MLANQSLWHGIVLVLTIGYQFYYTEEHLYVCFGGGGRNLWQSYGIFTYLEGIGMPTATTESFRGSRILPRFIIGVDALCRVH